MDKSLIPLVLSALALAVVVGVVFQQLYPETEVDAGLGTLFVLAGLLMALLLRTSWRALRGSNQ
jgi:hydrogenase-4 membrane subunit HyfE